MSVLMNGLLRLKSFVDWLPEITNRQWRYKFSLNPLQSGRIDSLIRSHTLKDWSERVFLGKRTIKLLTKQVWILLINEYMHANTHYYLFIPIFHQCIRYREQRMILHGMDRVCSCQITFWRWLQVTERILQEKKSTSSVKSELKYVQIFPWY